MRMCLRRLSGSRLSMGLVGWWIGTMGRASREKGKRGEREFAEALRDAGWTDARRGRQYRGTEDSPDVVGLPGVHLEVKRRERLEVEKWCLQVEAEAPEGAVPVVAWRRNRQRWRVSLPLEDFLRLLG